MHTVGLIVAAGLSRRMGAFKPLMPVAGKPLLVHTVGSMLAGGAQSVVVVIGHRGQEVAAALQGFAPALLTLVENPHYATTDMLASVQIGLQAMPPCGAFWLLPGDLPAVSPATFQALSAALQGSPALLAFPTVDGYRKHPPLVRTACRQAIGQYGGSEGLRGLWQRFAGRIAEVPVQDPGCLMDADTPEDLAALTAYMHSQAALRNDPVAYQTGKVDEA